MSMPEPAAVPDAHVVPIHRIRRILVGAGAVLGVLFVVGVVPRLVLRHRLRAGADAVQNRVLTVSTVNPHRAPEVLAIPLPGSMEAILQTGIWARTDGYLNARYVDI